MSTPITQIFTDIDHRLGFLSAPHRRGIGTRLSGRGPTPAQTTAHLAATSTDKSGGVPMSRIPENYAAIGVAVKLQARVQNASDPWPKKKKSATPFWSGYGS